MTPDRIRIENEQSAVPESERREFPDDAPAERPDVISVDIEQHQACAVVHRDETVPVRPDPPRVVEGTRPRSSHAENAGNPVGPVDFNAPAEFSVHDEKFAGTADAHTER